MTSPALSISTVSPILMSLRLISSWLCSVALLTVTPETKTGSNFATGVSAPVLPTWISISFIIEKPFSAENLWAIAHLGTLDKFPNLPCSSKLFTLYTIPSIS